MDKITTMNRQHLMVVYPFICGATMEKDYDYVLHGNNGYICHFRQHFWANVEMFDFFSGLGLKDYREASQHWLR
jgi:hypothetical protein